VHTERQAKFRFLRRSDAQTACDWAINENQRHLSSFCVEGRARCFASLKRDWAVRSRIEPTKAVARMIDRGNGTIAPPCDH
jgi:hypothetical protein